MSNVKAYAAHNAQGILEPWNLERRTLGPKDVQIDILYCGVCHSDLHQIKNEWGGSVYPMIPGHEIVGRVSQVGKDVKKFKAGQLAGVGCLVDSCRHCDNCAKGLEQYCLNGNSPTYNGYEQDKKTPTYGGYSKMIVADEEFVLKISDKLPLQNVAPLLCAGITTYSPMRHWNVSKGHKVGVLGLGGLGHMAVKFGAAFGAEVTMLSSSPSKKEDAHKLGAHKFILTRDADQLKAVSNYFDFIIDTVSAPHNYNQFIGLLKTDGVHICVGAPPAPSEIMGLALIMGRRSLVGSLIGGLPETQEMLDFCAEHEIVSDIELIPIRDIQKSYERMLKGDVKYRFVIDMATL